MLINIDILARLFRLKEAIIKKVFLKTDALEISSREG